MKSKFNSIMTDKEITHRRDDASDIKNPLRRVKHANAAKAAQASHFKPKGREPLQTVETGHLKACPVCREQPHGTDDDRLKEDLE